VLVGDHQRDRPLRNQGKGCRFMHDVANEREHSGIVVNQDDRAVYRQAPSSS
jgi:hypothetical protein